MLRSFMKEIGVEWPESESSDGEDSQEEEDEDGDETDHEEEEEEEEEDDDDDDDDEKNDGNEPVDPMLVADMSSPKGSGDMLKSGGSKTGVGSKVFHIFC